MFHHVPTEPGALRRSSAIAHSEIAYQQRYCLMGEALLFQTNHAALLDLATEAFGRYGAPPADPMPLVIQMFVVDRPTGPIADAGGRTHPKAIVHTGGHLLNLNVGSANTLVADLRAGFALAHITPELLQDPAFVRYTFIETAGLSMLGPARDFVPVHAACVVKDGVSIMLKAAAGTGKSTLAHASLYRGYQALSEDVVHLKVRPQAVELWGMPWKFHLLRDSTRFFPELATESLLMQVNGEWKIELELDALFPNATVTRAAPGIIVLLERDEAGPSTLVEDLSPEAVRQEFDVIWSWTTGWKREYEQQIGGLLARHVYRLHMNGSPFAAVDVLDALVAQYRDEVPAAAPAAHSHAAAA